MIAIGFHIEGIGQTLAGGADKGTVFYSSYQDDGWFDVSGADTADYTWEKALVELPSESESKADPARGELDVAAYQPHLTLTNTVSRLLNARQSKPRFWLNGDITDSDTTLDFGGAGLFTTMPTDVYIGEESIRVHTDNGDGTYECERGIWSSDALAHAGSSDPQEPRAGVFDRPPFYDDRLITFIVVDRDRNVYQRAFCKWDGEETKRVNTRFSIDTSSAYQMAKGAEVYNGAYTYYFAVGAPQQNPQTYPERPDTPDGITFTQVAKNKDASGRKNGVWYGNRKENGEPYDYQAFHVKRIEEQSGDAPSESETLNMAGTNANDVARLENVARFRPDQLRPSIQEYKDIFPATWYSNSGGVGGNVRNVTTYKAWEVAHWDYYNRVTPFPNQDAESAFNINNAAWHPLCIAAALLFSTNADQIRPSELDFLGQTMSLEAGFLFGDQGKQSFIDAAQKTPNNLVGKFTVGWGGKPFNVLNQVLHLLVSNGYFLAPRQDGYLQVQQFQTITGQEAAAAKDRKVTPIFPSGGGATWNWRPDSEMQTHVLGGPVGNTKLAEGVKEEAFGIEASPRLTKMQDPETREYEFPFYRAARGVGYDATTARDFLQRQVELLQMRMPTVTFEAPDSMHKSFDYDIGTWINIQQPDEANPDLFFEEDGTRIDPSTLEKPWRFYGRIIGRTWNPTKNSYKLTCLLMNYDVDPGKFRAPAGLFKDYGASSSDVVLKYNSFGSGQEDAQTFEAGQEIMVLEGKDLSGGVSNPQTAEIQAINSDTLDLDQDVSMSEDDVVTLAEYDNFTLTNGLGIREHAYLADGNDELGDNGDEADRWQ